MHFVSNGQKRWVGATARRWLHFTLYVFLGGCLAEPFHQVYWAAVKGTFFIKRTAALTTPCGIFGYLLAIVLLRIAVGWLQPKVNHFANIWAYPPISAAVILGYIGFVVCGMPNAENELELLCKYGPLVVISLVVALCWYFSAAPKTTMPPEPELTTEGVERVASFTPEKIIHWLNNQGPVRNTAADMVGLRRRAEKLLKTANSYRTGADRVTIKQTCAVLGPFGVGKTSLIELLMRLAESPPYASRIVVAYTSCWGFESSARAQEHVLEACVQRLHEFVDCSSLRRLPASYGHAMSAAPGWFKSLGSLFSTTADPIDALKQFTSILDALDVTLLVVVEDIDRGGENFDMPQLMAMFHHLREVNHLSFILTVSKPPEVELHKIVESIERLPPLQPDFGQAIVAKVRGFLTQVPFIDPVSFLPKKNEVSVEEVFRRIPSDWLKSVTNLSATFRTLKGSLSSVERRWRDLRGEVNLDELIMLMAIQECAPRAFSFLQRNFSELWMMTRFTLSDAADKVEKVELTARLKSDWMRVATSVEFDTQAAAEVLAELFPASTEIFDLPARGRNRRFQTISGDDGRRYLDRIVYGILNDGNHDQPALAILKALVEKQPDAPKSAAVAVIDNPDLGKLVIAFVRELHCLSQAIRLSVVSEILSSIRNRYGVEASMHVEEMGEFDTWIPELGGEINTLRDWIMNEIALSLPGHLALAIELLHPAVNHPGLQTPVSERTVSLVQSKLVVLSGKEFAAVCSTERPFFLVPLFEIYSGDLTDWRWLVPLVLEGMREVPEKMIPLAVSTFLNGSDNPQALATEKITAFFGQEENKFYSLIAECGDLSTDEILNNRAFGRARSAAVAWLKSHKKA